MDRKKPCIKAHLNKFQLRLFIDADIQTLLMFGDISIVLNVKYYVSCNSALVSSYFAHGCPVLPYMVSVSPPCCYGLWFYLLCYSAFKLNFRAKINHEALCVVQCLVLFLLFRLVMIFNPVARSVKSL